jgi:hypothetical protein
MWVPPSGWQEFLSNYSALQQLKVPQQYQSAVNALLRSGQALLSDSNNEITVADDDVKQWLYSAQMLASRLHNTTMAQSAQQGVDAQQGVFADVGNFWNVHPLTMLQEAEAALANPLEQALFWGAVMLGAYLLVPPIIRAIRN